MDNNRPPWEMTWDQGEEKSAPPPADNSPWKLDWESVGPPEQGPTGPTPSQVVSGIRHGLADQFLGATQLIANLDPARGLKDRLFLGVEEATGIPLTVPTLNKEIREGEEEYQKQRGKSKGLDVPRMAGNLINPLNLAATTLGGPTLLRNLTMGAATGLIQPSKDSGEDFIREKITQGGVGGLAAGVLGSGAGAVRRVVSPEVPPNIRMLREMGVTPTIGQRLGPTASRFEENLTGIPLLGDLVRGARNRSVEDYNRGIANNILRRVGSELPADQPPGYQMVDQVARTLSDNYERVLPNLVARMDNPFRQEVANVQRMGLMFPEAQRNQLDRILQTQVFDKFTPQGNANGRTIKEIEHQLGHFAHGYLRSNDFDQQQLGTALREVQRQLRDLVSRQNPGEAELLQANNRAWSDFLRMERAALKAHRDEGVFTPSNYLQAVKDLNPTRRKATFARGNDPLQELAQAGQTILGNRVHDEAIVPRSLIGMGMLGGLGYFQPASALTLGMTALPYVSGGQRVADALLSGGMGWRRPIGRAIERTAPLLGSGAALGALSYPSLLYGSED